MLTVGGLTRPRWECVHFATGQQVQSAVSRLSEDEICNVFEIEATGIANRGQLLEALAESLDFPDYFGNNWDAFLDCLRAVSYTHLTLPTIYSV